MGFPKSLLAASPGASPLVSLALAVATSVLVLNSVQPAQAYRTLRQDDQKHALGTPFNSYGCGYFNVSDPQDAGIPHQACYGRDGGIEFCCLSGSSKCSCPLVTGSELGCYNYEAGNSLNANTGDECGWFVPKQSTLRRELAGCSCPQINPVCPFNGPTDLGGGAILCEIGTMSDGLQCIYNSTTGDPVSLGEPLGPCTCPDRATGC